MEPLKPTPPPAPADARAAAFEADLDRQDFAIEAGRVWLCPIPEPFCQDVRAVTHAVQLAAETAGKLCKAADVGALRICITWDETTPERQAEVAQRRVAEARRNSLILPTGARRDAPA